MKKIVVKSVLGILAAAIAASAPALAIDNGGPVDQAKAAKVIGEMANGYLGFVKTPTQAQIELNRQINEINAKRKMFYTETSAKYGQTIDAAAVTAALKQISERTEMGEMFRDTNSVWCAKSASSVIKAEADGTIVIKCK